MRQFHIRRREIPGTAPWYVEENGKDLLVGFYSSTQASESLVTMCDTMQITRDEYQTEIHY